MANNGSAAGAGLTASGQVALLIGTRKGAFILESDPTRDCWTIRGPHFLGHLAYHLVLDPRDGQTLLAATRVEHLGPTLFRSTDRGLTWEEATRPPAFPKAAEGEKGDNVHHVFWLAPGLASEPGVWYAGSSPPGLFRSEDGGQTWEGIAGFNAHPKRTDWLGDFQETPPGGATLHSINVDPRDPAHLYVGASAGGVFESTDGGATWQPLNKGSVALFHPDPEPEYGQDPHCVALHPLSPDRLYQQNHCGIYRMERTAGRWVRVGDNMPGEIGDIGFPIVLHPRDPDTLWVFPMDGTEVWPRTSPDARPAAYISRDAGESWQRQDRGLPPEHAYFTVKRQAMTIDRHDPAGLYFGTTSGELWGSTDEGETWRCLARHLPEIMAVEAAELDG
jgi:photosystem II stability/assembly factor-like uncharacterized protein